MTNVQTPKGNLKPLNEIIEGLKKDDIELSPHNETLYENLNSYFSSNIIKKILANRYNDMESVKKYFNTKLSEIINKDFIENELPDVTISTPIINKHIEENNKILLVTDMDVDGVTSAAIGHKMLEDVLEYSNFEVIVNKRVNGNGINSVLTDEIINYCKQDTSVKLMILSDHGSHDKENLTIIKEATGIDIIVTDHHLFTEDEAPFNMDAFINPQRWDTILTDMTGTGVLYFVLLHARFVKGDISEDILNKIYYLLIYVGLTLISDCMDLKNYINRKILIKTLSDLNNRRLDFDPFWQFIIRQNSSTYMIDETTLGFNVIPMLNSPGRIADARYSYEIMVAKSVDMVEKLYRDIQEINESRKSKQSRALVSKKKTEFSDGVIKIMCIDDSEGVQGIIANNVMNNEGYKIVLVFTKKRRNDGYILIGSGRSQEEGLNLGDLVTEVANKSDLVLSHGGHAKAIGVKINDDLESFYKLLKAEVDKNKVEEKKITYIEDYIFSTKKLLLTIFDVIDTGPYGIGFEKPLFCSDFIVDSYRIFKRDKILLSFKVKFNKNSNSSVSVFYTIKQKDLEEVEEHLKKGSIARLVYNFNVNTYRNKNKILLQPVKMIFKEDI